MNSKLYYALAFPLSPGRDRHNAEPPGRTEMLPRPNRNLTSTVFAVSLPGCHPSGTAAMLHSLHRRVYTRYCGSFGDVMLHVFETRIYSAAKYQLLITAPSINQVISMYAGGAVQDVGPSEEFHGIAETSLRLLFSVWCIITGGAARWESPMVAVSGCSVPPSYDCFQLL